MFGGLFSREQESWLDRWLTGRMKSTRHANSDHLERALPVSKLKPGVNGQVATTSGGDVVWATPASGVTDHGLLSGLSDDDHTQYHNDARGDARYWQLSTDLATQAELDAHKSSSDHDGRYYTETETDSLLNAKQNTISDGGLSLAKLDIDGGTDIGAALVDADLIIVDDGAGGTNRKSAMSRVWTYISGKLTGAISTVLTSNLTASRALVSNGSGKLAAASVTSTELGYVAGVTSAIQTQLTANATAVSDHLADTTDAHDASAVSFDDSGLSVVSASDVQGAIEDLDAAVTSGGIASSIGDAKGDLIGFSADNTPVKIPAAAGDGYVATSDNSVPSGVGWKQGAGSYIASMYLANSGAPTHTSNGAWQYVADGGGTDTWTSYVDKRPSGTSAQVDTSTNKRIDIRKTGLYRVTARMGFNSIADGKLIGVSPGFNGSSNPYVALVVGGTHEQTIEVSDVFSCVSGDWFKLMAYQNDSASEAYQVAATRSCSLTVEYLGEA